ncbi:MAG TPA: copper resistance CopC family protein [Longimicrobium sp.]|nr:copper resistance CopC family protein [Longimicrobium sp.]
MNLLRENVAMMAVVSTKAVRRLAGMAAAVLVAGAAVAARPEVMRAEPAAAAFHLHLLRSTPAADSTVTSPARVQLWFSESPELAVTSVRMTGPGGRAVRLGRLQAEREHSVVANVQGRLAAGRYTLTWRTMSRDGHAMRGTIPFTVRAAR